MKKGAKAQLFTLDLLLALIPLTIALGMSANAISGVSMQLEDYVTLYSEQRIATDVLDALVKAPGEPFDWTSPDELETLGFATSLGDWGCGTGLSNTTLSNILDKTKLSNFQENPTNSVISSTLQNLSSGKSIRIIITNTTGTVVDVMGYYPGGTWTVTNNSGTISSVMAGLTDFYVAERPVGIITQSLSVLELETSFVLDANAIATAPAVGDLDGDGTREIVVGTGIPNQGGKVYAFQSDGTIIWTNTDINNSFWYSSPNLIDIDGDSLLEVLIGDTNWATGSIYAIDDDGSLLWSYDLSGETWSSPAVADLEPDGNVDVIIGDWGGLLFELDGSTGAENWNYSTSGNPFLSTPAIGEIDSNPTNYEIVTGDCMNIYVIGPNGPTLGLPLYEYNTGGGCLQSKPTVFDVDDGGGDEIFFAVGGFLYAITDVGGILDLFWASPVDVNVDYSSPAVGDLDNDGIPEIVVGGWPMVDGSNIWAFNAEDGSSLWSSTLGNTIQTSPALGDVDGDCRMEVVVVANDGLYILNGEDGSTIYEYSTASSVSYSSPVIADVDDDNVLEIVFGDNGGNFYIINAAGSSGAEWQMLGQCSKRAGYYYDQDCSGSLRSSTSEEAGESSESGNLQIYLW